jgi:acetoin utilization deacetylase AcuC-like enzyme
MVKVAWSSLYCHPLPEGHRFPMLKYELIPEQLIREGTIEESQIFLPEKLEKWEAELAHSPEYLEDMLSLRLEPAMVRRIGFPLSQRLIEREWNIAKGTISCAESALKNGVAFNVAGGTHHAFSNAGEGFCILNDIALGAKWLLHEKKAGKILVVDLDVHQGNGTAQIFENEPRVYTFSMHGQNNFPLKKEKSDLDIGLPDGISDEPYLKLLDFHLKRLINNLEPDFIFYQAGVDILETDRLGRLKISRKGCASRDRIVFSICHKNKIPVVTVMGGGYSPDIKEIVETHCETFRQALHFYG